MGKQAYKTRAGKRCPSVTTVLEQFKNPRPLMYWASELSEEGIDFKEVFNSTGETGTETHRLINEYLSGKQVDSENIQAKKAFATFCHWNTRQQLKPIVMESAFICECGEHEPFGGTPDFFGTMFGVPAIIDWKTSSKLMPDHLIQIGGYFHLISKGYEVSSGKNYSTPEEIHLVRFDRDDGSFDHLVRSREQAVFLDKAFLKYRDLYEVQKQVSKIMKHE